MLCYTLLSAEFLFRFRFQKPFISGGKGMFLLDSPSNEEFRKSKTIDDRPHLPPRINLMVLGMALSTALVFVRFASSQSRLPPPTFSVL